MGTNDQSGEDNLSPFFVYTCLSPTADFSNLWRQTIISWLNRLCFSGRAQNVSELIESRCKTFCWCQKHVWIVISGSPTTHQKLPSDDIVNASTRSQMTSTWISICQQPGPHKIVMNVKICNTAHRPLLCFSSISSFWTAKSSFKYAKQRDL